MDSLEQIFQQAYDDPNTKIDPEWVDQWLESLGERVNEYHYLENKTVASIAEEKERLLDPFTDKDKWLQSLLMYRPVYDLQDLRLGYHTRWIREKSPDLFILTNGGIAVQTKFLKNGTYVVCKNGFTMMQYQLDKCITFQKLSAEEWMILYAQQATVKNV